MRMPNRSAVVAPILAAILATSAVAMAATWTLRGASGAGAAPKSLRLKGHVVGMYPGRHTTLKVRVSNPLTDQVTVRSIKVKVASGSGPFGTCSAGMIKVKPWRGKAHVPAHRSLAIPIKISMSSSAPDACQGARWKLTYSATSVRG